MLIDEFLPTYDVQSKHAIVVDAPAAVVFQHVCHIDLKNSPLIRLLFKLRGMPASALSLEGLEKMHFARLATIENEEILLGLVGRFWRLDGDLQDINTDSFVAFDKAGYARAVWSFNLFEQPDSKTLLTTETRVQCTDDKSAKRFSRYWKLIGPFSGLTRTAMLKLIKKNAEQEAGRLSNA